MNNIIPKKKEGIINHNLETKNLNETPGIVLLIVVINIHPKYKKIAIVIGCLTIDVSIFLFKKNFTPKIIIRITNKGSVNNDKLNSISGIKNDKLNDKGVKKAIKKNILSYALSKIAPKSNANGKNEK